MAWHRLGDNHGSEERGRATWSARFQFEHEEDLLFGRGNPNPERIACVSVDELLALACRQIRIGDPRYEHLVTCSPCYREMRALQQMLTTPLWDAH